MEQQVIPTLPRMGRGLINHDPRSKQHRAVDLLDAGLEPKTKTWRRGLAYDQGRTPHCVAFTGKGVLNTSPLSALVDYDQRSRLSTQVFYDGAQRNDEWEGEAYDGTSGLGLCRFLKGLGLINEYRWCFSLGDYLLTLSHIGPIGFGTWWKGGMWNTDGLGFIHADGSNDGGHEVELIGVNVEREYVIGMNSWGRYWGAGGRFLLSFTDLERLINEQADGFVITG